MHEGRVRGFTGARIELRLIGNPESTVGETIDLRRNLLKGIFVFNLPQRNGITDLVQLRVQQAQNDIGRLTFSHGPCNDSFTAA
ncbi:MAG: hypothetical protein M3O00_10890 [Pseudomonadota bacterium]|nr:hypothetical protein [Pseudomonadota bacterium]